MIGSGIELADGKGFRVVGAWRVYDGETDSRGETTTSLRGDPINASSEVRLVEDRGDGSAILYLFISMGDRWNESSCLGKEGSTWDDRCD